jgi:hypothetical protein
MRMVLFAGVAWLMICGIFACWFSLLRVRVYCWLHGIPWERSTDCPCESCVDRRRLRLVSDRVPAIAKVAKWRRLRIRLKIFLLHPAWYVWYGWIVR